jgi:Nif-specific regulatory protein
MSLERHPHWLSIEHDLFLRLLELSGTTEEIEAFLEEALALLVRLVRASAGYLELRERSNPEQVAVSWSVAHGQLLEELSDIRELVSHHLIQLTLAQRRRVMTSCANEDRRFEDDESGGRIGVGVLCVPIGAPPIGVVYLQAREKGEPHPDAIELAQLFGRQVARVADVLLARKRRDDVDHTLAVRTRFKADEMIGSSSALARALDDAALAASCDASVLLTGPSGTGKSALARVIARNSRRADGPFVQLNCAALPESLFESELFGAREGAHSTAQRDIEGKVHAAEGGTLFLDEISELALPAQAKLLQLVESMEYFPLGSNEVRRADVRWIAATNADLAERVKQQRFREDLYYRLNVLHIAMPTLAQRPEDIDALCRFFCHDVCAAQGWAPITLAPSALLHARENDWPGNLRELRRAIERGVLRARAARSDVVHHHHLFADWYPDHASPRYTLRRAIADFVRRCIAAALEACNGCVRDAANHLGISRSNLYHRMETLGVETPQSARHEARVSPRKSRTRVTRAATKTRSRSSA